jgi:hypothetical protein
VQSSDVGSRITLTVTRTGRYDYLSGDGSLTSAPTDVVANIGEATPGLLFTPIISGGTPPSNPPGAPTGNITAYSVSKGTSSVSLVIIPSVYQGLPVTEIEVSGFASYTDLTSIIIPDTVLKIGDNAFFNCGNLQSVIIPATATIGNLAFSNCSSLTTVYYRGTSLEWAAKSKGSSNEPLISADIYYYAAEDPGTTNRDWHLVGDAPRIWVQNQGLAFTLIYDEQGNGTYSVSKGTATAAEIIIPIAYEGLPVTAIADWGFQSYTNLTSVTIPKSITSIGYGAFSGCSGLTGVTIPDSVTSIGDRAFSGCSGLTGVTIPDSVTSIGDGAFSGCSGLTSITIPNTVTSIGGGVFSDCSGLESITVASGNTVYRSEGNCIIRITDNTLIQGCKNSIIPDSVTSIGDSAFSGCSGLTGSLTIPKSITSIGRGAFFGCSGLTGSLTIPNGVTSIGGWAFSGCSGLTSVTIPASVTSIGEEAFNNHYGDDSGLTSISVNSNNPNYASQDGILYNKAKTEIIHVPQFISGNVTIPNGVTDIGDWFSNCWGLTSITIGNSVTDIGDLAFRYCSGLTSVTIGNSVKTIGNLFSDNGGGRLTSVTIPASVTSIGAYAFSRCSGLTRVFYGGADSTAWGNIAMDDGNYNLTNATRYYYSAVEKAGNYWRYVDGIPEVWDESSIAPGSRGLAYTLINNDTEYAVSRGTSIEAVIIIPEEYDSLPVTMIGLRGFSGYTTMTSVTIPASVTSIGGIAFNDCSSLMSITIPDSVTSISYDAFSGCSGLTSITVASGNTVYWSEGNCLIQRADNTLIRGCKNSVIPNGVESIGNSAFSGCSGLTSVTIPASVTSIGAYAFSGCSGLTSISVNSNNPNYASQDGILYNKAKTEIIHVPRLISGNVTIPNGVTDIGNWFSSCYGLTSVTIPNGVTSIGEGAFSSCYGLTSVTIGNSVMSIGNRAFYGCSGLTSVTIPNGVESIGNEAFYGCSGLMSITIPNSVASIGNRAFYGCGLESIAVTSGNTVYRSEGNCLIRIADNTLIMGCKNSVIPNSVTNIGNEAFNGCSNLTSITIPASVTSIGDGAFFNCSGLTSVTFATGSNISSSNFGNVVFTMPQSRDNNLKAVYLVGGAGTYEREADGTAWTKR